MSKIIEHGKPKIYAIADNRSGYRRFQRMLSGENQCDELVEEIIHDTMLDESVQKLSKDDLVFLLHDPCDIRKPHSMKAEKLGKVRSLDNQIINGYSSYNIVAVTPKDKNIQLISHAAYSNKDERFVKESDLRKLKADKEFDNRDQIQHCYESGVWFNKSKLTKQYITESSQAFKKHNSTIKLTHVLDREFDAESYFTHIINLQDNFVIRAKKSRTLPNDGKDTQKLIDAKFDHTEREHIKKLRIKGKVYQDVQIEISWMAYRSYSAVRISILNRQGKAIFKHPMLLLTSFTSVRFVEPKKHQIPVLSRDISLKILSDI